MASPKGPRPKKDREETSSADEGQRKAILHARVNEKVGVFSPQDSHDSTMQLTSLLNSIAIEETGWKIMRGSFRANFPPIEDLKAMESGRARSFLKSYFLPGFKAAIKRRMRALEKTSLAEPSVESFVYKRNSARGLSAEVKLTFLASVRLNAGMKILDELEAQSNKEAESRKESIQASLNLLIGMSFPTFEKRKETAKRITGMLKLNGLVPLCPKCRVPAAFSAKNPGSYQEGAFQFIHVLESGKRADHCSSMDLPQIPIETISWRIREKP